MNFKPFDTAKIDQYTAEAKERWGSTDAYKEYEQKAQKNSPSDALMALFAEAGKLRHLSPDSPEAQAAVANIQAFITDHYYTCTKPILSGLGQMYVADERFKANIDAAGGQGCAEFVSKAIDFYCK